MTLDSRKTEKNLLKKGFKEAGNKSNDHKWLEYWHNGKLTIVKTKLSHNGQDLNDYLISKMSKQIHLSKSEFIDFCNCNIDQEEYSKILQTKSII